MPKEKLYIAQTYFGRYDEITKRFCLDKEVVEKLLKDSLDVDVDVYEDIDVHDRRWVLSYAIRAVLMDNSNFRAEIEEFISGGKDSLSFDPEEAAVGLGRTKEQANDAYLKARVGDESVWEEDD